MRSPQVEDLKRRIEDTVASVVDERERAAVVYDLARAIYDGVKRVTYEPGAGFDGKDTEERQSAADMMELAYNHMQKH
jgi:hypothetical protein